MILHCDADAFFASAEQAADKRLRGRAIAVGGERRGIIASASYEARKLGIYAYELELFGYIVSGHPLDLHPQVAWYTNCPIDELHRYPNQRVTVCGLIIVSRSHLAGERPAHEVHLDLRPQWHCGVRDFCRRLPFIRFEHHRYLVVQITGEVKPFDNQAGYTLDVLRVERGRYVADSGINESARRSILF